MKVISFNANGIRACAKNGFYDWLLLQDPDFVCLQETKSQVHQLLPESLYFPNSYFCDYYDAEKKGYSGVAIYSKHKPMQVVKGFGYHHCDFEGRYIQFDYPKLSVVSLYMPSGTSGEGRQEIKYDFLKQFASHIEKLKKAGRELILCGDYNIAHKKIDLKHWRQNQKNSGFLPEERAWMDELFGRMGMVDAFRVHNQEEEQYTWWSYRTRGLEKNIGWRIDYQVITPGLSAHVVDSRIFKELRLSDHAPLLIEYSGEWCV